jgi:16S rRNA (cytidine1402-2'-O)-methyltransferase
VVGQGFAFIGFLPAKGGERTQALSAAAARAETLVLFEAPHRIEALLQGLATECPERTVTVCRELTKQFESVETRLARELPAWLAEDTNRSRGEFVLVLHALAPRSAPSGADAHDKTLLVLMAELPLKQAVALAAELTGAPRNALYARALELKAQASG